MSKFEKTDPPFCAAYTATPGKLRVLAMEEALFDLTRIRRLVDTLELDTHYTEANSLADMTRACAGHSFDLVLIRHDPEHFRDRRAIDALLRSSAASILLIGDAPETVGLSALAKGFGDYLSDADMTAEGIRHAVFQALRIARAQPAARRLTTPCTK